MYYTHWYGEIRKLSILLYMVFSDILEGRKKLAFYLYRATKNPKLTIVYKLQKAEEHDVSNVLTYATDD